MKLQITINTQHINDDETARILQKLTDHVRRFGTPIAVKLKDSTGNEVGTAWTRFEGPAEYARSASIISPKRRKVRA